MTNPFDEVRSAVAAAEMQLRAADRAASSMAELLVGRLRRVETNKWNDNLANLKRELRDYDITTRKWKTP